MADNKTIKNNAVKKKYKRRLLLNHLKKEDTYNKLKDVAVNLISIGCTIDEVSSILQISKPTLYLKYGSDIEHAKNQFRANLRNAQFQKAVEEKNTQMLIWLGKQYLGQSDKVDTKHTLDSPQVVSYGESLEPFSEGTSYDRIELDTEENP
jgi:hypothetical protein